MKPLSEAIQKSKKSSIRKLFELVLTAKSAISFGIGQPDFTPPQTVLDAMTQAIKDKKTMYAPTLGLDELREAVANKFKTENQMKWAEKKNIIITSGGSQAIQFAFAALSNPGDEMIIDSPNFLSYYYMAGFYNLKCVEIPRKKDFSINIEEIKKKITPKTKFLLINTPNNPTGYVYSKQEMDAVVQLVIENDLYLISDEVYEKFLYGNRIHYSPASYPGMEDRTITMNAMSKTFGGPGLRLGYIAAPEAVITEMEKYSQYTSAGVSHVTQYGAIAAMKYGNPDMPKVIERYDKKRTFCVKRLNELGFDVVEPFGAFYIMPSVTPFEKDANTFSTKLMKEAEVAVVPGADFGSYSDNRIRISYATEDAKLEEGFNRIEKFLKANYKK